MPDNIIRTFTVEQKERICVLCRKICRLYNNGEAAGVSDLRKNLLSCAIHAKDAQIRRRLCISHIWYPNQGCKEQAADTRARIVLYGTELHQIVNRSGAVCRADEPVFHSVRHIENILQIFRPTPSQKTEQHLVKLGVENRKGSILPRMLIKGISRLRHGGAEIATLFQCCSYGGCGGEL